MRIMWLARLARPDLSRVVTWLGTMAQAWTKACDAYLYRAICYLECTKDAMHGTQESTCFSLHIAKKSAMWMVSPLCNAASFTLYSSSTESKSHVPMDPTPSNFLRIA